MEAGEGPEWPGVAPRKKCFSCQGCLRWSNTYFRSLRGMWVRRGREGATIRTQGSMPSKDGFRCIFTTWLIETIAPIPQMTKLNFRVVQGQSIRIQAPICLPQSCALLMTPCLDRPLFQDPCSHFKPVLKMYRSINVGNIT